MTSISSPARWRFSGADGGFIGIVSVACFSALLRVRYGGRPPYSRSELLILVASIIVYLVVGTYGFAICRRKTSVRLAALYLSFQVVLAEMIIYLLVSQ